MDHPEFEITITAAGEVTVEIKGAKGPRCLNYADLLKELIGRETARELTREYYEPDGDVRIDTEVEQRRG